MIARSTSTNTINLTAIALLLSMLPSTDFRLSQSKQSSSKTHIIMLGTGTPSPDPDRSGPSTAIVVNGVPYLIDFGPGVVRRAAAAFQKVGPGLSVVGLKVVFLTHLHSDHTVGYPDLIFTPWPIGRKHPS